MLSGAAAELLQSGDVERFFTDHSDRGDTLWIFHHIPKTAGSSLSIELGSYIGPSHNFALDTYAKERSDLTGAERRELAIQHFLTVQQERNFRFAHGHLRRSHIRQLRAALPRVALFTILRDPFARTVSAYRYLQTSMHPGNADFIRQYPTFDAFLQADFGEAVNNRNAMCQYLTGSGADATFEEAREILEREYVFCGLLEAYPLSFAVVTTLVGRFALPTRHERKTPDIVANEVLDPKSYRRKIYALNAEDVKLFRFVRERLQANRGKLWEYMRSARSS